MPLVPRNTQTMRGANSIMKDYYGRRRKKKMRGPTVGAQALLEKIKNSQPQQSSGGIRAPQGPRDKGRVNLPRPRPIQRPRPMQPQGPTRKPGALQGLRPVGPRGRPFRPNKNKRLRRSFMRP